jgi:class 3 adenylate cyclase/predicted ATPase
MHALGPSDVFLFEDFRLDRRGLFRRAQGEVLVRVKIGSRTFDILQMLVERAGELVLKEEIIAAVWADRIIEDSNLTVQVSALRRALGHGQTDGNPIQTVAGRGYRFITPVTRCAVDVNHGAPADIDPARSAELHPSPITSVERRQLTVMICDLVGAIALSSRIDPEDLREITVAFHRAVAEVVARFDGFVGKSIGDGALVYFGFPRAHEEDAERAVRAGLALIDAVGRLAVSSVKLQTRVGIATGLVVIGDLIGEGLAREQSIVGETPHLAVWLKELAEPDTVVIAAGTHRLIGDLFEYRDLGGVAVKDITTPVPAWRVLRPSELASRFEALRGSVLSPLIGRDEEIDLLLRRWARAKAGDGQIVLVSGEPGLGKSRIAATLEERLHAEPHFHLRYFCSPYHQDSALYPVIDQLGRASGFGHDDPPAVRLEKLEALLAVAAPPEEDLALLADLMSLPASDHHKLPMLSSRQNKERTLEALIRQLEGLARRQPVIAVFEDAHWIDPTSCELLDLAVELVRNLPVLLIVTFRLEFQPPWAGQAQVTLLALNRLDRRHRTALVAQIASGKALPVEVVAQIVDRSDGVPLFIEELTKSVLESGLLHEKADRYVLDGALPPLAIPTTLHDSLMARLDRLASVRHVVQIGAAIGREFSYPLLQAVSRLSAEDLHTALARLRASEMVFHRGTPPDAVYGFKHALVQDAAHGSLPRDARRQLHAQIAAALETHHPELMDGQPETFAQHYAEAGLVEKSVASWRKAGRRSAARSAMAEAAAQLQKGLDQLALLPDTTDRQFQELEFCGALGAALMASKGYAARDTGHAYARARELWEELGSPSAFLHIPYGQSRYHVYCGEVDVALRLDDDLLRLSRQCGDSSGLVLGHLSSGRNLMLAGRFAAARSHLEQVLALYDPVHHQSLTGQIGIHPALSAQAILGNVLFFLGFPNRALARTNAAIVEAERLGHAPSLAQTLTFGTRLLSQYGDNAALAHRAEQFCTLATEQGFSVWRAQGTMYRGLSMVTDGAVLEGMALLRAGLADYRANASEAETAAYNALLARACEIAGQVDEALAVLDDALPILERAGERRFAAELRRHKGQLLLRQGHTEAAEELYRKALSIAEEQEAKLWELRAAVSLARLRHDQGRHTEARDLLEPVYRWFTEGFDTPDLREATTLLDELA